MEEVFQFDLEMNSNIYRMHFIIREDYWRPFWVAGSYLFFSKKADSTYRLGRKTPPIKVVNLGPLFRV